LVEASRIFDDALFGIRFIGQLKLAVDVVPRRLRPFTWRRVDYRLFFLSLTNGKVRHPATMTDDAPGAVSSIVKLQPNKKDCNTSGTHRLARLCTNYVQTT